MGSIQIRIFKPRISVQGIVTAVPDKSSAYCINYDVWLGDVVDDYYTAYKRDDSDQREILIAIGHSPEDVAKKTLDKMFRYIDQEIRDKKLVFLNDSRKEERGLDKLTEVLLSRFES